MSLPTATLLESNNIIPKKTFSESATPSAPAADRQTMHLRTDGAMETIDESSKMRILGGAILTADPIAPADNSWWCMRDGGAPEKVIIKCRIGGVTMDIIAITL